MKVRITKSTNGGWWYSLHIGKEFEVTEADNKVDWLIVGPTREGWLIDKRDTIEVKEEEEEEVKISKKNLLAAAAKCSQVKDALKNIFPDVFKEEKEVISLPYLNDYYYEGKFLIGSDSDKNKYTLSNAFEWKIVENRLVVTKK